MLLEEKKCTKCNSIKDISEFYNRIGSIDGKTSECKVCTMIMYENRKEKYENIDVVIPENKKCHTCEITKEIKEFDKKKIHLMVIKFGVKNVAVIMLKTKE